MHTQTAEICQASIFYQVLGKSFPGTELTPVTVRRTQIMLYLWQLCRMHTESLFKLLQGLLGFRKLSKKKKNGELYWSSRELSLSYYYCNLCILEAEMEKSEHQHISIQSNHQTRSNTVLPSQWSKEQKHSAHQNQLSPLTQAVRGRESSL